MELGNAFDHQHETKARALDIQGLEGLWQFILGWDMPLQTCSQAQQKSIGEFGADVIHVGTQIPWATGLGFNHPHYRCLVFLLAQQQKLSDLYALL